MNGLECERVDITLRQFTLKFPLWETEERARDAKMPLLVELPDVFVTVYSYKTLRSNYIHTLLMKISTLNITVQMLTELNFN